MTTHQLVVRRFLLVALALPVALTALGVAVQLAVVGDLPDPIAIHWGAGGEPDGYAAPLTSVITTAALGLGLPLLLTVGCWSGLRAGDHGPTYRLLAATSAATTTLLVALSTWLIVMQVGLDDAREAGSVWLPMAASFAVAALAAVAGWRLQPKVEDAGRSTPVPAAQLAPGQRLAWVHTAALRPRWAFLAVALSVVLALATVATWLLAGGEPAATLAVVTVVTVVAIACITSFRVRADATGLTVRSAPGLPVFRVPLDDIASVGVLTIRGMGDYGGWGIRWMPGRLGVILRSGEALEVVRHSGKRFAVTVDDAATGAAVLQAHLDR